MGVESWGLSVRWVLYFCTTILAFWLETLVVHFGCKKSSVCVPKMGQFRTWMTDRSTELVPLLKIGNFPAAYVECQIGVWRKILVLCWKEITLVY